MYVLRNNEAEFTQLKDGVTRKIAYLNNMLTAIIEFSGNPMTEPEKPHSHPHEQISYVAKGKVMVILGDEKHFLDEGDLFMVPSGLPHAIQTLTPEVKLIDTFTPVRRDFL